ncbi:MAG: fused MFS/spermidine synthase [Candidatus Riflebacteria bacterium]|nr:fused MFS/spermidine synthase [Candidatus Riflebacteria bacterium]
MGPGRRAIFGATAFLGSFLLFFAEPLAGKELLPLAGGSFMVWAVALAFFQTALLASYLAVHAVFGTRVTGFRAAAYLVAVGAGLLVWVPLEGLGSPGRSFAWWEWWALARLVGLPFLALGTGQLALQRWWQAGSDAPPGFIFAASNAGSLAGLLAFPLLVEPRWAAPAIWTGWHAGTATWAAGLVLCLAWPRSPRRGPEVPLPETGGGDGPSSGGKTADVPSPAGMADDVQPAGLVAATGLTPSSCQAAEGTLRPVVPGLPAGFEGLGDLAIGHPEGGPGSAGPAAPTFADHALPALAGAALLGATTNLMTMDVAAFPLLWVLPLAVYLVTWIRAFAETPPDLSFWDTRFPDLLTAGFALALIGQLGFTLEATVKFAGYLIILYYAGLICHTTARLRRPEDPAGLTRFYLALAVGGAAGSLFVAFGAPLLFGGLGEYPVALFLAAWAVAGPPPWRFESPDPFLGIRAAGLALLVFGLPALFNRGMPDTGAFLVTAAVGALFYLGHCLREAHRRGRNRAATAGLVALCLLGLDAYGTSGTVREVVRNFYGLYKIYDSDNTRFLQMGSTFHGHESLEAGRRGQPLYYYHPATPIGSFLGRRPPGWQRAGVVGLGAGIIAAYGQPGQIIDFFELDPDGLDLARRWFSYLASSPASVTVTIGDGRLSLRRAAPGTYDLLLLDAFSSDAIPIHLLTLEAIAEYRQALRPDGLLLFHVSNRHFDLRPLLAAAGGRLGLEVRQAENPDPEDPLVYPTRWVAMGTPAGLARHLADLPGWTAPATGTPGLEPWTDRFSSLWSIWASVQEFRIPTRPGRDRPFPPASKGGEPSQEVPASGTLGGSGLVPTGTATPAAP